MNHVKTQALLARLIDVLSGGANELTRVEAYAKHWKNKEDGLLRLQDKVAAETILLAYLASRVPLVDAKLSHAVERLCDRAEAYIFTGRNEALLRRFPQTAATLGVGFVLLSQLGRNKPSIERLLRRAVSQGFVTLSERSTFRLMDTRWTYGLLDSDLVRPVEELLPLSTLAASPHPIYTMNEDNYALTHAIYYLTDFGRRPPPLAFQQGSDRLLNPFLAWNAIRTDLDLLGEFLIAAIVLRQPRSPAFRFAWRLFFKAWDENSGLVGPEFSSTRFANLNGEEAAAYAFSENYHTAFVGGILCAVALTVSQPSRWAQIQDASHTHASLANRCSDAVARVTDTGRGVPGYEPSLPRAVDLPEWIGSRLLMALQTPPTPAPQWLRVAMDCDLSREELASVLYDALLVEAARSYSLVQLTEALAVGASHAALRSPTFTRCLGFLLDQQLDDGFIGVSGLLAEEPGSSSAAEAQATIARLLAHITNALSH